MNPLTQQGINALKLGDRTAARQLLAAAIKQDPRDVTAWLWLAGAMDKEEEQIDCLRYVLKIDPQNQNAARGLAQLLEKRATPVAAAAPTPAAQPPSRPLEPEPASARPQAAEPLPEKPATPSSGLSPIDSMRESIQILDEAPAAPADTIDTAPPEPMAEVVAEADAAAEASTAAVESADNMVEGAQLVEKPEQSLLASITAASRLPFRRRARPVEEPSARLIFRERPSLVPALACFWLFLVGALVVGSLLKDLETLGLLLSAGIGFLLEFVVLYVVIRGLAERYELTSQQLTLRQRGKRAIIPIGDIYNAELTQSFFQRLLGIGNIEIDASVGGQLSHLRLRNIPQCRLRKDQIMYLVNDHDAT